MKVKIGTYTGNGNNPRGIIGIGFQPIIVQIKAISNSDSRLKTSSIPSTNSVFMRQNSNSDANGIQSLDADGFTVGSYMNANTVVHEYIAIGDDGSNDVQVFTYTGDGTNGRVIPLNFTPEYVVIRSDLSNGVAISKFSTNAATKSSVSYGGSDITNGIKAIGTNQITIDNNNSTNANTLVYYGYALKTLAGFIKCVDYTGDGAASHDITTVGFQPDLVWIKGDTSQNPNVVTKNTTAGNSYPISGTNITTGILALIATGFTVGNSATVNSNGVTYHAFCLKIPLGLSRKSTMGLMGIGA